MRQTGRASVPQGAGAEQAHADHVAGLISGREPAVVARRPCVGTSCQTSGLAARRLHQHERLGGSSSTSASTSGASGSPSRPSARCRIAGASPIQLRQLRAVGAGALGAAVVDEVFDAMPGGAFPLQACGRCRPPPQPASGRRSRSRPASGERAQHVADDRPVGDQLQAALTRRAQPWTGRLGSWRERR